MDFTLYWFMFPVSMLVATTAMLSGIGGAALFTPIFVIIFPLLGPEYPLSSTVAAIGTALLTETFGFSSGFIGYFRKGLIDYGTAWRFIRIAVPVAIVGALVAHLVADHFLILGYAALMLILSLVMVFLHHQLAEPVEAAVPNPAGSTVGAARADAEMREIHARDGVVHRYRRPRIGPIGAMVTSVGAFLTGMLSVGIGEVVMPQLTKRGVPVGVAAATSVMAVIVTVALASFTQISKLIAEGGLSAVPWNLVCYTIPAVIIGGQIGPRLQGKVDQHTMERAIGALFLVIAVAMAYIGVMRLFAS
ncbi:MAG: sulfite exporter TauE/SafE family protein [Methyloligellaceae bacterium]